MTIQSHLPLPDSDIFTPGDLVRREEIIRLRDFVIANFGNVPDAICPGKPRDWNDAKASLFAHPGVVYSIRTVAAIHALEQFAFLNLFNVLRPDDYLAELNEELAQATGEAVKERIAARIETVNRDGKACLSPIHADHSARSRHLTFQLCKRVLNDWLTVIPAENFQNLLKEIERLETASITAQMKFFGLIDLIPV